MAVVSVFSGLLAIFQDALRVVSGEDSIPVLFRKDRSRI